MYELDYSATEASVGSALASASGADRAYGQTLADALADAASVYHSRYSAAGVDAAKGAWIAALTAAHNQADTRARYLLSLAGVTASPLTVDLYDPTAILARMADAQKKTSNPTLLALLNAQSGAYQAAWSGEPSAFTTAPVIHVDPPWIDRAVILAALDATERKQTNDLAALAARANVTAEQLRAAVGAYPNRPPSVTRTIGESVRALELATYHAMTACQAWLDAMAFT